MNNDETLRPARRSLVLAAAGLTMVGMGGLVGCASKPKVAPKPVNLLAILPVDNQAAAAREFKARGASQPVYMPTLHPVGLLAGALTMAAMDAAERDRREEHDALQRALAKVDFDFVAQVNERLDACLAERGVRFVRLTDPVAAGHIRYGNYASLPPGVDAILDLAVTEADFYYATHARRGGGWSPNLLLSATLRPLSVDAPHLDYFEYYADYRSGGKNKRWLTTPPSMIFPTLPDLEKRSDEARLGLRDVTGQMVDLMAADLQRHTRGEMRFD